MPIGTKNSVVSGCGLHHVSLQTRNLDEALSLYGDVLGMTVVARAILPGREIVLLDMGDGSHMELVGSLAAGSTPGPEASGPARSDLYAHIALATTAIEATLARIVAAGYKVTCPLTDVALGEKQATIAFFEGPSGEAIELWQDR
jgi:catechol 2,3-dioxygenase-like lactoylglutathione lyase family enzyme